MGTKQFLASLMLLVSALFLSSPSDQESGPDWKVLRFYEEDYRIVEAQVVIEWDTTISWRGGPALDAQDIQFEILDEKKLAYLEKVLTHPLAIATAGDSGGFSGWRRIGGITLKTTREDVKIQITNAGFLLGDELVSHDHIFYSWGLAKLIDEQAKKEDAGFEDSNFSLLSGLMLSEFDALDYEKLLASTTEEENESNEEQENDSGVENGS